MDYFSFNFHSLYGLHCPHLLFFSVAFFQLFLPLHLHYLIIPHHITKNPKIYYLIPIILWYAHTDRKLIRIFFLFKDCLIFWATTLHLWVDCTSRYCGGLSFVVSSQSLFDTLITIILNGKSKFKEFCKLLNSSCCKHQHSAYNFKQLVSFWIVQHAHTIDNHVRISTKSYA